MSSLAVSVLVFACVCSGALAGVGLRAAVPPHHRDTESRDLVKLGMGFIGTMAALLLGLLVASTKGSYDAQKNDLTELSTRIVFLDRILAHYGSEADEPRLELRRAVGRVLDQIWPDERTKAPDLDPTASEAEGLYDRIEALSPATDSQRTLKAQAIATAAEISKMRWHLFEQSGTSVSTPLIVVVVSWLSVIFIGLGYCAPRNATVLVTLFICVLTVSSALFLILEMDQPFAGVIHIRSDALRSAEAHLGKGV